MQAFRPAVGEVQVHGDRLLLGDRTLNTAHDFMHDLAARLANRVQLTTDGHRVYLKAMETAFNEDIDYAMLSQIFQSNQAETRYSPAVCIGCETKINNGNPDVQHVSTSYVERQNLTMRMSMRCFTRLTNASLKNWRTTRRWWACTSCITTLAWCIRRSA